jgi:hypothetical protein
VPYTMGAIYFCNFQTICYIYLLNARVKGNKSQKVI